MKTTIILSIFLPVVVFGEPQLSSSIGSLELSGEQCPGTLTLTCDAVRLGPSGSINWFVGDDRLAVFDFIIDSTPFTTTTSPNLLNATVQLLSATLTNGQFSYINFTLSAGLSDFLSLQGQNITCGSFVMRSSSFEITEFALINESSSYPDTEVSYLVNYNGLDGKLSEIMLSWIERVPNCTNVVSYSVKISNGVNFMTRNFTSEICNSNECSIEIILDQNAASDVVVDFHAEDTLISTKVIAGTTGNNVSVDECSGEVSIRCSDLNTNENCTINYQQDGMDFIKTIPPLTLVSFPLEIEQFQVVIKNGSVVLHQSFGVLNGAGSDVAALIVVGAILYLLGLIENLIVYVVWLRKKTKQQAVGLHSKMLILIVSTTLMFFIISILWIVAFINTEDLCGTLRSTVIAIYSVALVFSIMITLISTIILAVVLIVWPCNIENDTQEKSYDFTLGMTDMNFDSNIVEGKCPNCGIELSLLVKFTENFSHIFCDVCGKRMCMDCQYTKVFLFRMMGFGRACNDCTHVYWEQNKQFANNDDTIGEMSLLWRKKCAEPCSKCNDESTDTNLTCDFCGKGICSKNHVRRVTEKKEKTIGNSNKNEEKVDSEITSGMQQKDTQDNVDIKTHVDSGEKGQEISEVGEKGAGLQDKQAKERQVCRMCYTVYNRKNHFITTKE